MKIKEFIKKVDYRHYICVFLTFVCLSFSIWVFPYAFSRLIESIIDLFNSLSYYFTEIFGNPGTVSPTVQEFSKMPFEMPFNLPETWEEFELWWHDYWELFKSSDNFEAYVDSVGIFIFNASRYLLIFLPVILLMLFIMGKLFNSQNNDYNKETKPLKIFKRISSKTYRPIKQWCIDFVHFVKAHKYYFIIWCFIWAFNFNFISIAVEFFAFYFYFIISFDAKNIYEQFIKLLRDLCPMIDFFPGFAWITIGYLLLHLFRKSIAYKRLHHMEMQDRGFINERPIVTMIVGTMGKKKTTILTDISLSTEVMFRDKAYELILENDLKFPFFPWINLENSLRGAMENHSVYNLTTCKRFIRSKKKKWLKRQNRQNIFMYDYKRYGMTYNNDLSVSNIWSVLETYAQLYFIYIVQSSLLISNYSIRSDMLIDDIGNFPLWNSDFFKRDARLIESHSRHSHILDFDMLRLGKKMIENNKKSDCFEFGIIDMTEIGKERGNNLELQETKKNSPEANQKNDLFNSTLKMIRHSATVDNFPFVKILTDEQRPESWGADARDLCEIVNIDECSDKRLAMPFFWLEELLHDWIFCWFVKTYQKYRYNRSDNCLTMHLLKKFIQVMHTAYIRLYNRFGYMKLDILVESGRLDGQLKERKYYLMPKKIYSKRFSTDCYADYFNQKALKSSIGLDDLQEYATEKATMEELQQQNSYFINDLMKIQNKDTTNEQKISTKK